MIVTATHINDISTTGRLGNQLFIIASIIGLAKDYEVEFSFPKWKYSNRFNIEDEIHRDTLLCGKRYDYKESCHGYDDKIPHEIMYCSEWGYDILNIHGYLQDYKYFDNSVDYIRWLFSTEDKQEQKNICSIHVRRGDYINLPNHHPCCSMNYYNKSINFIKEKHKPVRFKIFSDDINWCKQNFHGVEFEFVEGNDEVTDMLMMSECEHNIIANSSFSWWGAYLNNNPNKTVIKPKQWFGKALNDLNTDGYKLPDWIEL